MTDSLSQYCLNCETQANTIEELRAANERWAIAFNQAEERAIDAVKALQADKALLRGTLGFYATWGVVSPSQDDVVREDGGDCARAALQETER